MFRAVADIDDLVSRQETLDREDKLGPLSALKASHPDVDIDDIIPSALERFSGGIMCDICDCPTVGVESKSKGEIIRVCRDILSAIKMASLIHRDFEICIRCKIIKNPNGVVAGALHMTMDIEDSEDDGVIKTGMRTRIAAGKVFLDSDTNEVRIDD